MRRKKKFLVSARGKFFFCLRNFRGCVWPKFLTKSENFWWRCGPRGDLQLTLFCCFSCSFNWNSQFLVGRKIFFFLAFRPPFSYYEIFGGAKKMAKNWWKSRFFQGTSGPHWDLQLTPLAQETCSFRQRTLFCTWQKIFFFRPVGHRFCTMKFSGVRKKWPKTGQKVG